MSEWTKQKFFEKMDWEGSFEDMASYCGHVKITDDVDMNDAWRAFNNALQDLQDIYDDWWDKQEVEDDWDD